MRGERNAFLVGLTMIAMVGLLFAVLLFLAGRGWGRTTQEITVRFAHDTVLPVLKPGSAVYCGASQVGQVRRVWFGGKDPDAAPDRSEALYVYVRADVDAALGLRGDCHIVAQGPLLGGTGTLVIRNRGVSGRRVEENTVIDGKQARTFDALTEMLASELDATSPSSLLANIKTQLDPHAASSLVAKIHASLDDINTISARMNREFDPDQRDVLMAKLHETLSNINAATRMLKGELESGKEAALLYGVHRAIDSVNEGLKEAVAILKENRQPIHSTLVELESSARTVNREIIAQLAEEFDPQNEGSMLKGVHRALNRVNTSLDNLAVVSGTAKEIVVLNKHNINAALNDLRAAGDYLKGGMKFVFSQPWLLLNPPTDKDSKERQIADAAREFSEAATKLDDTMSHLRAVLELRGGQVSSQDERLQEARLQLEEARSRFGRAETFLWQTISAQ